jgi:RNA polymerase sigma factor (sigma-70 family)
MRGDRDLLAEYGATGSEAAFAELARRHGPMVYRTCLRCLGDASAAEDAAQAAFVVLVRRRRQLRSEGNLAGWLHRVARNAAHLAARSRGRRRRHEEAAAMVRKRAAGGPAGAGRGEELEHLDAELDRLPAAQRQAVVLRYLEGRSQEESARLAGCPQGTLARRAQLGLERLRARLCRRGQVLALPGLTAILAAEAGAASPASLLPSLLAVPKLAAGGAAAGAAGAAGTGAGAAVLADGVLKMMLWTKVKFAAALIGALLVVGGAGGTLAGRMRAGEPVGEPAGPKGPQAAADPAGQAVNGVKLVIGIAPKLICGEKCAAASRRGALMNGVHKCSTCDKMCMLTAKHCAACAQRLSVCMICGARIDQPTTFEAGKPLPVRAGFENVGEKDELIYMWDLSCSKAHECYTLVFTDLKTGRKYEKHEPRDPSWKNVPWRFGLRRGREAAPWIRTFADAKMETGGGRLGAGEYSLQVVYSNDDDGAGYPRLGEAAGKIWTGTVRSNVLRIVLTEGAGGAPAAGEAVNGLRLKLEAQGATTCRFAPRPGGPYGAFPWPGAGTPWPRFTLSFCSQAKDDLKLDTYRLTDGKLWLEVVGPDAASVDVKIHPPGSLDRMHPRSVVRLPSGETISGDEWNKRQVPKAGDYTRLPAGQTWGDTVAFPGPLEAGRFGRMYRCYSVKKPGEYRIRAVYVNEKIDNDLEKGAWTGKVVSNEVVVKITPQEGAAAAPRVFTGKDSGSTVRVPVGRTFEIRMVGNQPRTGWEFPLYGNRPEIGTPGNDKAVLWIEGSDFIPRAGAADGAVGTYVYRYRAARVGQAVIEGVYVCPGGPGVGERSRAALRGRFKLTVRVVAAEPAAGRAVGGLPGAGAP